MSESVYCYSALLNTLLLLYILFRLKRSWRMPVEMPSYIMPPATSRRSRDTPTISMNVPMAPLTSQCSPPRYTSLPLLCIASSLSYSQEKLVHVMYNNVMIVIIVCIANVSHSHFVIACTYTDRSV